MFSTQTIRLALSTVAPMAIVACDDEADQMMQPEEVNVVEAAEAAGSFNTLIAALDATGLRSTLETGGTFTVFAPTDSAFAALPAGTVDALLADPDALSELLLHHVLEGNVGSSEVAAATFLPTLNGQAATIAPTASGLSIDGANIVDTDIAASNGTIHVIDQVILPSTGDVVALAVADTPFSTIVSLLQAANLVGTLQGDGPFTAFAPTNEAFAAVPASLLNTLQNDVDLLTQVLTYHVVSGRAIDNAVVTATDLQGTNGVVHVLNAVLLPPGVAAVAASN